jgi:hypothetical protein
MLKRRIGTETGEPALTHCEKLPIDAYIAGGLAASKPLSPPAITQQTPTRAASILARLQRNRLKRRESGLVAP